jgi:enamine deaminase RidA (YjgF/YER057c/UK114 family)
MPHIQLRKTSTRGSYLTPDLDYELSEAVVADDQVFLGGQTGLTLDGKGFVGEGDPAAQAEEAMKNVRILLEEAGAKMEDVCLVNNYTTNREDRAKVYPVIARHLESVNPVSTGLIVKSLAEPYIDFEIDVWTIIPRDRQRGHERLRLTNAKGGYLMPTLDFGNSKVIRANNHVFLQGQTGMSLDGRGFEGEGDPGKQAGVAMKNVKELLADVGASLNDVCKITTYLTDPSHRVQIDPVLSKHFRDIHPVVTTTVVKGLARPELNFEIDVFANLSDTVGGRIERFGVGKSNDILGPHCPLSQIVRAGNFIFLPGQSGLKPDGTELFGPGDPAAQADQAMQNVKDLLKEAGASVSDICKVTTYVRDHSARAKVYPVISHHLGSVGPTFTGVVVEELSSPELDFEIDVFAVTG